VHDEGIDESECRVFESGRQPSDNVEAVRLPGPNRATIGAHDEVELHREKRSCPRASDRVFEHRAPDPFTLRCRGRHVATVGDMAPATSLVRAKKVGAENTSLIFCDEHFVAFAVPICECLVPTDVSRQGIGLSCAEHRLQNGPNPVSVVSSRGADQQHTPFSSIGTLDARLRRDRLVARFSVAADYNPILAFEKLAEMKIREAIDAGEFDHLPNAGARLDLEPYFTIPEHLRMGYSVLKNANCVPEEVHLLNNVARLEAEVADAADSAVAARLSTDLQYARLRLALALEHLRAANPHATEA
jgi:DnaJ-like protein